jgi:hypothetical protein
MERFVADLVKNFESGKRILSNHRACRHRLRPATPPTPRPRPDFKVLGINHFSYTCPDYTRAREFFIAVFGLTTARIPATGPT